MNTWINVARFNLQRRTNYLVLPWILPFAFAVGAVTAGRGNRAGHRRLWPVHALLPASCRTYWTDRGMPRG